MVLNNHSKGAIYLITQGILYLFGGLVEDSNDRQFTHKDLYCLGKFLMVDILYLTYCRVVLPKNNSQIKKVSNPLAHFLAITSIIWYFYKRRISTVSLKIIACTIYFEAGEL